MSMTVQKTGASVAHTCGNVACQKEDTTLRRCSRCRDAWYCDAACQKAAWPLHKKVCKVLPKVTAPAGRLPVVAMERTRVVPPGLQHHLDVISRVVHDNFVAAMDKGEGRKCKGHYDRFSFPDDDAFDLAFAPMFNEVFRLLKSIKFLTPGDLPRGNKIYVSLVSYDKDGYIDKHIDDPFQSGSKVIVASFNTPVVVNFYNDKTSPPQNHKLFVPPRSVYMIADEARHSWSHAILADENTFEGQPFERGRRYAAVFTPPGPLVPDERLVHLQGNLF